MQQSSFDDGYENSSVLMLGQNSTFPRRFHMKTIRCERDLYLNFRLNQEGASGM